MIAVLHIAMLALLVLLPSRSSCSSRGTTFAGAIPAKK